MNNVVLMGRLTHGPELRQTQSGISYCRFTIAINRKFKNKDTGEYDTDFIPCIAWKQTAEFITRYFSKGKMIAIQGNLHTGSYQDRNHQDVTHYTTDVFVENVEFCGNKGNNSGNQQQPQQRPHYDSVNDEAGKQYAQQLQQAAEQTAMSYGNLSDFEEILSDGDVPF